MSKRRRFFNKFFVIPMGALIILLYGAILVARLIEQDFTPIWAIPVDFFMVGMGIFIIVDSAQRLRKDGK